MFEWWRKLLPIIFIIVLTHSVKDITQDILKIPTLLDVFGDVKEDLSALPAFLQRIFILFGYGSFMAEIFLLISIPTVLKRNNNSRLEKAVILIIVLLLLYFLSAVLLDPVLVELYK